MPGRVADSDEPTLRWRDRLRRRFAPRRIRVEDESMYPTLLPGDRLLLDVSAFRTHPPVAGDLVVARDPEVSDRWLVKRVGAVGSGRVWITMIGVLPADGPPPSDVVETVEVPPGTVFLVSDHAAAGRDSRRFGPVPLTSLVGRVYFRYYPPDRRQAL